MFKSSIRDKRNRDGFFWKCKHYRNPDSIRKRSVFENFYKDFCFIFKNLYKRINNFYIQDALQLERITRQPLSKQRIVIVSIILYEIEAEEQVIGGLDNNRNKRVLIFKRKYYRGDKKDGCWYIGGVKRNSKKAFISRVENKNAHTLRSVIDTHVLLGFRIITNEWRAYNAVCYNNELYMHDTVNHFV